MSTNQKIFIGIFVLVAVIVAIVVIKYYNTKGPEVATTTTMSQTSGLSAVAGSAGGVGGIGALFAALSDERFKENINRNVSLTGYGSAYNMIDVLSPVEYMYRDASGVQPCERGCSTKGVKRLGFIAQEVEKVNPNLVITDKDGIKYIDMMQFIALNTAALKKLKIDNEYLKGLITANPQYGGRATN